MNEIHKFSVDEALDCADLRFTNYSPTAKALEFFNYIRIFTGSDFEVDSPLWHYFLVDMLLGNVTRDQFPYSAEINSKITVDPSAIAILASRGSAKSTVTTLFYPIYASILGSTPVTGPLSHMLILSDSQQGGSTSQARIMASTFEKSVFAKEWFESMRFTDTEIELVRANQGKKKLPIEKRHMLIKFKGVSAGGIRSGSRNPVTGDRYALIIGDDIIKNEADSYSEVIMGNVKTALESDAENAMRSKNTQMILINTPFHSRDPIYSIVEGGAYTPLVMPICKEITLDTKKEEFVGLWEEAHSYESVMKRWRKAVANGSTRSFNQELMLRVSNEEDRMISDDMIQWYDRNMIMKMIDGYNLYITTDFTTTSAAKSDFSGIALWAVSNNNDYFLLDISLRRLELVEQYDALFRMIVQYGSSKPIEVGVEIDGQQKAHIFSLKEMMQKKNRYFSFAKQKGAPVGREGILSKVGGASKLERFRYILPMFQNKKIYLPEQLKDTPDVKELLKHWKGTTHAGFSGHDDGCFTADTEIMMADGSVKCIIDVQIGDMVMTYGSDSASSQVLYATMTGNKLVREYVMEDGSRFKATDNHPVLTDDGWKPIGELTSGDTILRIDTCKQNTQVKNGQVKRMGITKVQQYLKMVKENGYISMFGNKLMGLSQKVMKCII